MYAKYFPDYQRFFFSDDDNGGIEITQEERDALLAGEAEGKIISADASGAPILIDPVPVAPTKDQQIAANKAAISRAMEDAAQARGYDNLLSAISYASDPPQTRYQAEGAAFRDWRLAVWEQCFAVLGQVVDGTMEMPSSADAVAAMPKLELPT